MRLKVLERNIEIQKNISNFLIDGIFIRKKGYDISSLQSVNCSDSSLGIL